MIGIARGVAVLALGVLLSSASVVPAAAAEPVSAGPGPVLSAAPVPCSPDWIHIYMRTGQPVGAWVARIAGTDLGKLVGPAGHVDVTIQDADGTEQFSRPFDRNTPFSAAITLNGPNPTVVPAFRS